jgi:hypothetical protein
VQFLNVQSTLPPDQNMEKTFDSLVRLLQTWDAKTAEGMAASGFDLDRMRRQFAAANAWGVCKLGETVSGDGKREAAVKLMCERGIMFARVSVDEANKLKTLDLVPTRDQRCVP